MASTFDAVAYSYCLAIAEAFAVAFAYTWVGVVLEMRHRELAARWW